MHVEDDNGRMFYVGGCVNERAAVDEDDKPLVLSTIRREIPQMDDLEFERLDKLSGGKLRHLLVGSPGGYSWTQDVETILSFEHQWKTKRGIPVDRKMLPHKERMELFEKEGVLEQLEALDKPEILEKEEKKKELSSREVS